jgi:hydrogenase expression/formation protein HypC
MCLAIPAKVVEIKEDNLAQVDLLGVGREVSLDLTPHAQVGDFVLVHAGFAIERMKKEQALENLAAIREVADALG